MSEAEQAGGRRHHRRGGRKSGSTTPALAEVAKAAEAGAISPEALEALRLELEQEPTAPPPADASGPTPTLPADVPVDPAISVAANPPPVAETAGSSPSVVGEDSIDPDAARISAVVAEALRTQDNASGEDSPSVRPHVTPGSTTPPEASTVKTISLFGKNIDIKTTTNDKGETVLDTAALEARVTEVEKAWLPPKAKQWVIPAAAGVVVGAAVTATTMVYGLGYERKSEGGEQPAQLRAAK